MDLKKWLRLSFINLLIVAALGVILRYKIAFSLPFVDQKKLLHGHSHFAFSGWISLALMALIVSRLTTYNNKATFKRYNWILWANAVSAYGMLLSFPVQGYGLISIIFSTCSCVISYFFMAYVWKDIRDAQRKSILLPWIQAATFFNALSTVGTYFLAYMIATKSTHQTWYLAAIYFFLHFQYNGWFTFTVFGLLHEKLAEVRILKYKLKTIFRLFFLVTFPAYFLSALWMPMPAIVYAIVIASAILQVYGWASTVVLVRSKRKLLRSTLSSVPRGIIILSFIAFSVKFLLQLGSTIPRLGVLAFGFRPIVIGYLHLVMLGCISLFIIGYAIYKQALSIGTGNKIGILVFVFGIILNELALMIQGSAAIKYTSIPYINEALFYIALIMFSGLLAFNIRIKGRDSNAAVRLTTIHE